MAYTSSHGLYTRSNIAGKLKTISVSDHAANVLSQGPKEVENKEPPPPPPYGKEGADTTEEPSPPFPTAKKGCETAKDPSVPSAPASVGEETADEPPLPPTSWEEVLHLRLAAHNEDRDAAGHGHGYHQIASASGMTLDDVLIAVATFWEPLRNQGTGFAFAGASVIDQYLQQMAANGLVPDLGVVGEGNVFIMPLWFPPDLEDTEKRFKENHEIKNKGQNAKAKAKKGNSIALGHLLLGVAEKDSGQSKKVNIKIFDSRPITLERDLIRKRATELACAWLGPAVKTEFDFRTVPQQQENSNACGLHVILNAWAIMLGIGLITQRVRPREGCEQHPGFLENGLAIVNLALAGFMDSRTIQAFLNYYGHTAVEDPLFREDDTKNTVIAVSMDSNRFERALGRPSPSSSQTSAHNNSSTDVKKAVSESKVQQFMEMATNATLELAEHFIATEGEDVEKALTAFAVHQSQLDGPTGSETS